LAQQDGAKVDRQVEVKYVGLSGDYVWLGKMLVPERCRVEVYGTDGRPDWVAEFEIRSGAPECTSLRWEARPGGRGIRTSDLQFVQLDNLAAKVFAKKARWPQTDGGGSTPVVSMAMTDGTSTASVDDQMYWRAVGEVSEAIATRGRGATPEVLAEVAKVYSANISGSPTTAVERWFGYSRRTAARRVRQARDAGLLPKTQQGRRKGVDDGER
jgi:hypothetical protein